VYQRILEMRLIPGVAEGGGDFVGEVSRDGVHGVLGNRLSEFCLAAARSDQGQVRSSREKGGAKQCQGGARTR
jgi:hypothetical protein